MVSGFGTTATQQKGKAKHVLPRKKTPQTQARQLWYGDAAKAVCQQRRVCMIQKPAAAFRSERNTLGHDARPGHVCPQQHHSGLARHCCASFVHCLLPAPGLLSLPPSMSNKRSQPYPPPIIQLYPPPTITGTDVGSCSCQGCTSGPEWELLISSSARDGRMAD